MVLTVSIQMLQRSLVVLAALVCLVFVATLIDIPPSELVIEQVSAPPLPSNVGERTGRLTIDVRNAAGDPVAGADVTVLLVRAEIAYLAAHRQTDTAGRTVVGELPHGEIWVLVRSDRHARTSTRLVLDAEPRAASLVLRPAHQLAVRVAGDDQKLIAKATVEVRCADPLPFIASTGSDGTARFTQLCAPPFQVRVSAHGYEQVVRPGVMPGELPLRISLRKLGSVLVHVETEDATPAPLSRVFIAGAGVWPARQTQTDSEGNATIAGLPAGRYDLRAVRGDMLSAVSTGVVVERGRQSQVKLKLEQGRSLTVQVMDGDAADARPVNQASVVLVEGGLSSFPLEGHTDAEGKIVFRPVSMTAMTVSARAAGFVPTAAQSVPPGGVSWVRVDLIRGGTLLGDVVDARGFPVIGASIEVVGTDLGGLPIDESPSLNAFRAAHFSWALPGPAPLIPAGELGVMPGPIPPIPHGGPPAVPSGLLRAGGDVAPPVAWVTDHHGEFSVGPVPPGRVRAIVRHPAYVEGVSELVSLAPGGEARVHIVLQSGGTLEGRVVDERGFPVANARVQIAAQNGTSERSTLTADDGTFALAAVFRDITVTVSRPSAPDEVAFQAHVQVPNGERKKIEIVLRAERDPVEVRVTDDRGYPLDAAQIAALSLSEDSPLRSTVFTDKAGTARIADAAGIALRLECSAPGYATVVRTVNPAPKELVIALGAGTRVRGRVTGREGRDRVSDALVTAYVETGARHVRTDKNGEFQLPDLAAGPLRIRVDHKDYVMMERSFQIPEPSVRDRVHELPALDMQDAGEVEGEVVDERNDPVAGARVAKDAVPTYLPVGPLPPGVVATNRKGEFTLGGLPEGKVTLEAHLPDVGKGKVYDVEVYAQRTTHRVRITLHKTADSSSGDSLAGLVISLREGGPGAAGVVVKTVGSGSTAERAGMRQGDILVRIDGVTPSSVGDAMRRLGGPEHQDVWIEVQRGRATVPLRVTRERIRQ